MALIRVSASKEYFKVKTLTPIYPPYFSKFTDPNYYVDKEWRFSAEFKEEQKRNKEMLAVINEIKNNNNFNK